MWALAALAACVSLARAETEADYFQGPYNPKSSPAANPVVKGSPKAAPRVSAAGPALAKPKRLVTYNGYAAESARTATRMPADERQARDFLRKAALSARFETEAARLAQQRADSPAVREFAEELLQYHGAANAELVHLLAARGMAPPMMDNTQRKTLNRLGKLSGSRFDREFTAQLGRERQRADVRQYEKAVAGVSDPVLRAWIDRQLPSLRQQHTSASRLKLASWDGRGERGAASRQRVE
jgi:putative membrane protein